MLRASVSVLESLETFNHFATSIDSLVGTPELEIQDHSNDDHQCTGDHTGSDAGNVGWIVLAPENGATYDTTDAASSYKRRRAESAFPAKQIGSALIVGYN